MNFFNKFRNFSTLNRKYTYTLPLSAQQIQSFIRHLKTKTIESKNEDVIKNISEKLRCSEYKAKQIYNKFPLLRSADAIKDDSLELLCTNVSKQLIIEYPKLVTIDAGKSET